VYFHDLVVSNDAGPVAATDGTGDAIKIVANGGLPGLVRIERAYLLYAGRSAVRTVAPNLIDPPSNYLNRLTMRDVSIYGCKGHGFYLKLVASLDISESWTTNNHLCGGYLEDCGNGVVQLAAGANGVGLTSTTLEGQFVLKTCADIMIQGGNYEGFTPNTVKNAIVLLGSRGCVVGGNEFDNPRIPQNAGSRSIYLRDGSYGNTILSNLHADVDKMVEIDNAANDVGNMVLAQACQGGDANGPGKVVLPTGGRNFAFPTNLAGGFNDRKGVGLLLPSMPNVTTIDASVVQNGLLVFDSSDGKLKLRTGGAWVIVGKQT